MPAAGADVWCWCWGGWCCWVPLVLRVLLVLLVRVRVRVLVLRVRCGYGAGAVRVWVLVRCWCCVLHAACCCMLRAAACCKLLLLLRLRVIPRGPHPPRDGTASRRPARACPARVPCGRWAVNLMSLIMMALLGEYLCMRRELQDIPLFGSSVRRKPSDSF